MLHNEDEQEHVDDDGSDDDKMVPQIVQFIFQVIFSFGVSRINISAGNIAGYNLCLVVTAPSTFYHCLFPDQRCVR